jgi:hypothetical protein
MHQRRKKFFRSRQWKQSCIFGLRCAKEEEKKIFAAGGGNSLASLVCDAPKKKKNLEAGSGNSLASLVCDAPKKKTKIFRSRRFKQPCIFGLRCAKEKKINFIL